MNSQAFSLLYFLRLLSILLLFQSHHGSSSGDELYKACVNTFACGLNISEIGYPFRGSKDPAFCGHPGFVLSCDEENSVFKTTIDIMNIKYRVLGIDQTAQTMRIVREDLMVGTCPDEKVNTMLDFSLFDYTSAYRNITFLYNCPDPNIPDATPISCGKSGYTDSTADYVIPGTKGPGKCDNSVTVPIPTTGNTGAAGELTNATVRDQVLRQGVEVRWKVVNKACNDCMESKGRCGYDINSKQTTCFCPDAPYISSTCSMTAGASPDKTSSSTGTFSSCYLQWGTVSFSA